MEFNWENKGLNTFRKMIFHPHFRITPFNSFLALLLLGSLVACSPKPEVQPNAASEPEDKRPILRGRIDATGLGHYAESDPRVFVVPYLSQQQQNDLVETIEIVQRLKQAKVSFDQDKPETLSEEAAAIEDPQGALTEANRKVLEKMYPQIPNPIVREYGGKDSFTSSSELQRRFTGYFGKMRPQNVQDDLPKLNELALQEAQKLAVVAERNTHYGETINFMGIADEEWVQEDRTQKVSTTQEINQARTDLEWIVLFQKHLAEVAKQIGVSQHKLNQFVSATEDARRQQLAPIEAWQDFIKSRGIALNQGFSDLTRYKPEADGTFAIPGAGYIIAEVLIDGKPTYFAESIPGNPVKIQRLR